MSKNQLFNPIRDELIATCLVEADYRQASGLPSNNKLVVERLRDNDQLARQVVGNLAHLAIGHEADFLLPVPDGANWLAEAVSLETGIDYGLLHKADDGTVEALPDTDEQLTDASRVVIVEDVLNRLTTTRKVLAVPTVADKAKAVIAVFDRGPVDRDRLKLPMEAILRLPIAAILPKDDKLWPKPNET
jgi:adenine/guanine phosphoribosyltransferase-like PRPP-binding protein